MEKLEFSTGLKEFELAGGQVISFIPTDFNLMERIFTAFDVLDQYQNQYQKTGNEREDARAFFSYIRKVDARMQEAIDGIFGLPIDRAAFHGANLFALADGLPLWANFIFAVMDKMDAGMTTAQKEQNPRLQKLMAKYKRS